MGGAGITREPFQIGADICRRPIARFVIFLEQAEDDAVELGEKSRVSCPWSDGRLVQQLFEDDGRRGSIEGTSPCRQLIEHHAERPQIRSGIDGLTTGLFGRQWSTRSGLAAAEVEPLPGYPIQGRRHDLPAR